jgi:hypothetical protein
MNPLELESKMSFFLRSSLLFRKYSYSSIRKVNKILIAEKLGKKRERKRKAHLALFVLIYHTNLSKRGSKTGSLINKSKMRC